MSRCHDDTTIFGIAEEYRRRRLRIIFSDPSIPQILLSLRLSLELTAPLVDLRLELRPEGMADLDAEIGGRLHSIDCEGPIVLRGRKTRQGDPDVAETFTAPTCGKAAAPVPARHACFDLSAA